MKTLVELERIAITNDNRIPPERAAPRRERSAHEPQQQMLIKRTAVGLSIAARKKTRERLW